VVGKHRRCAGAGAGVEAVTVTLALALLEESAALVAVTVWLPAAEGAVYRPLAEMVPALLLPPATPSTDQLTVVLLLLLTVAENCTAPPAATVAEAGEMLTEMVPGAGSG